MSDLDQIVNNIKEEIMSPEPSVNLIISQFYDLRNLLWKELPRFYDIVGETFILDPDFFMTSIYAGTKFFHNRDMAKHIIEKFSLYEGEQILYEFKGDIKQVDDIKRNIKISVTGGTIFVTNYRIIAQGTLKASGGRSSSSTSIWRDLMIVDLLADLIGVPFRGKSKRAESMDSLIDGSVKQELPCYGFQFKRTNLGDLREKSKGVNYTMVNDDFQKKFNDASTFKKARILQKEAKFITITAPIEQLNELYEILRKEPMAPKPEQDNDSIKFIKE
ncbi:MAG: hypothetical protein ACFFDN_45275 [Candidatus Hodarchaeota archaeon]